MVFNSFDFLLFFPIVVLIYFIFPKKYGYLWLLIASYYFYMGWNAKYAILLLFSTVVTYLSGVAIGKAQNRFIKKVYVAISLLLNLTVLFFFKYYGFLTDNVVNCFANLNIDIGFPQFDFLLPVGISFYTFQALSYTIDVYRNEIEAEKNIFKYALFVSFFPQLVAGPIERSKNLLIQIQEPSTYDGIRVIDGLKTMLWGYFLKMVIADRIAIFVDKVYGEYETYGGVYLIVASMLFAFQIYCDFAGYSTIAVGAARVLGFQLMDNFESPYISQSIAEFWRRWHISLSSWFKDYLYIPLGGSRRGRQKKYRNIMIVFLTSGLWHGANWTYVIWGGMNGIFQIVGDLTASVRKRVKKGLSLDETAMSHKLMRSIITFLLIDFTWVFFRANTVQDAIAILQSMVTVKNLDILLDGSLYTLGLSQRSFWLMLGSICVLMIVDVLRARGISARQMIDRQEIWFRWFVYIGAIVAILVFGVWGPGYNEKSFIYFQF